MGCRKAKVGPLASGIAGIGLLVLSSGCSSGVPQADYDVIKQQAAASQQQAATLKQQLAAKEQEAADLQKKVNASSNVTTLIGVKAGPTPGPAPTPTPLPPGFTPPPKPIPPASLDQPVGPFYFYAEALTAGGTTKYGLSSTIPCTANSVYKRGSKVAFRFEVVDMSTGKRITDKDGAKIQLSIPGADTLTPRFGQRGNGSAPGAPWMWMTAWEIPTTYPIGAVDYGITVTTKDGRTGTFKVPHLVDGGGSSPVIDNVGVQVIE